MLSIRKLLNISKALLVMIGGLSAYFAHRLVVILVVCCAFISQANAADVNAVWDGTAESWEANWIFAPSWSTDPYYPDNGNGGLTFDVTINSGSVHLNGDTTIEDLNMGGGQITGWEGGQLKLIGSESLWTRGAIATPGGVFVAYGATMNVSPSNGSETGFNVGGKLRVGGVLNLNDPTGRQIWAFNGSDAIVQIDNTGVLDIRGRGGFGGKSSGEGIIKNEGMFKKTTNTNSAQLDSAWNIDNTGTVQVEAGSLQLFGSSVQLTGTTLNAGTWNVLNGSSLYLNLGSNIQTLGPAATVRLSGATANWAKINTLKTNNGTFQIDSGKNFTVTSLFTNDGELKIGNGSLMTVNDTAYTSDQALINISQGGSILANQLKTDWLILDGTATIRPNGGTTGSSRVETFAMGSNGKFNLKDNDFIVGTGNLAWVREKIKLGKLNNAPSGITSDVASFGTTTGFGYALGNDPSLSPLLTGSHLLAGQSFDNDSVLVKYTFLGDADLDGDNDLNDLGLWAQSFTGDLGNPAIPATFWTSGDFDYDGDTDLNDLGFWAGTFSGDLGGGAGSLIVVAPNAPAEAVAILNGMGITVVPEPNLFLAGSLAIAFLAFAVRRRSSNCKPRSMQEFRN